MYFILKALQLYDTNRSLRKTARALSEGKSTVHRWWVMFHKTFRRKDSTRKEKNRRTRIPKYKGIGEQLQRIFGTSGGNLAHFSLQSSIFNLLFNRSVPDEMETHTNYSIPGQIGDVLLPK